MNRNVNTEYVRIVIIALCRMKPGAELFLMTEVGRLMKVNVCNWRIRGKSLNMFYYYRREAVFNKSKYSIKKELTINFVYCNLKTRGVYSIHLNRRLEK